MNIAIEVGMVLKKERKKITRIWNDMKITIFIFGISILIEGAAIKCVSTVCVFNPS